MWHCRFYAVTIDKRPQTNLTNPISKPVDRAVQHHGGNLALILLVVGEIQKRVKYAYNQRSIKKPQTHEEETI